MGNNAGVTSVSSPGQPRLGRPPLVLLVPAVLAVLLLTVPLVSLVADTPWNRLRAQLSSSAVDRLGRISSTN